MKTRLKGNRRLSAGQSWCQKPKRETSGGGGTCQGRGPINPGPQLIGIHFYLKCGQCMLEHLYAFSDVLGLDISHKNISPLSNLQNHASADPPCKGLCFTDCNIMVEHIKVIKSVPPQHTHPENWLNMETTTEGTKHVQHSRKTRLPTSHVRNTQISATVQGPLKNPGNVDEGLQLFLLYHLVALEHLSLHLNTICQFSPGPFVLGQRPQSD